MNSKNSPAISRLGVYFPAPVLRLVAPVLAAMSLLVACEKAGVAAKPADVEYYTCTMHPSVRSQDPNGKCPICGMDLVPVKKTTAAAAAESPSSALEAANAPTNRMAQPSEFSVPVERLQQIGVTYGQIEQRPFRLSLRAVGLVADDKQRRWEYVTRVDGYIQKLFVFSPGELVESNAPLLTIYSPALLTTENEYLDAWRTWEATSGQGDPVVRESSRRLVDAAKRRLRLWNITEDEIAGLAKQGRPQDALTLRSPFQGVVQELGVGQGGRVAVGDRLVDVADLSVVWVWAEFYENELAWLKPGLPVSITTAAYPATTFSGRITVLDPFLNDASRTARVRIDVDNRQMQLRPGMYVDVHLQLDRGEGLAVPVSAVLPTGLRNLVFVDRGQGKLEPRFVELGRKYGDFYQVHSGLKEHERVVTSANFLIDAEAKVQGALKTW